MGLRSTEQRIVVSQIDEDGVDTTGFIDTPFDWAESQERSGVGRHSDMFRRVLPSVMLVQIDQGEEPPELKLAELPVRILRVRYPLPAAVRILVTRPMAVIIGEAVIERDLSFVFEAADEVGAATLQLGALVSQSALGNWLRRVLSKAQVRRPT